jgi:hypothetical protein
VKLLALREEHRLRVSEDRMLRIFGANSEEVTEDFRKLHEDLYNFQATLHQILLW